VSRVIKLKRATHWVKWSWRWLVQRHIDSMGHTIDRMKLKSRCHLLWSSVKIWSSFGCSDRSEHNSKRNLTRNDIRLSPSNVNTCSFRIIIFDNPDSNNVIVILPFNFDKILAQLRRLVYTSFDQPLSQLPCIWIYENCNLVRIGQATNEPFHINGI